MNKQQTNVDANLMIDAVTLQRDRANHEAAVAMVRATMFQMEAESLRAKVTELEAKLKQDAAT